MGTYPVFFILENFRGTSQRVLWKIFPLETFDYKVTAQNLFQYKLQEMTHFYQIKLVTANWTILESFMNLYIPALR